MPLRVLAAVKGYAPVLLISLAVAFVYTATASVFDQFHQVAAEDLNLTVVSAQRDAGNTQSLVFGQWGVTLTLPYGQGMGLMQYADEGSDSMGLTSADVATYGPACTAGNDAVGAIVRVPAAQFGEYPLQTRHSFELGSVAGYVYVYQLPQNSCMKIAPAANVAAQEALTIEGAGALAQSSQ